MNVRTTYAKGCKQLLSTDLGTPNGEQFSFLFWIKMSWLSWLFGGWRGILLDNTSGCSHLICVVRGTVTVRGGQTYQEGASFELPVGARYRLKFSKDSVALRWCKPCLTLQIFRKGGFTKYLFTDLGTPGNEQFSFFFWMKDGESLVHDHDVAEITYVVLGTMLEARISGGHIDVIQRHAGTAFCVPARTVHRVKATEESMTINWCDGPLHMNTFDDFPDVFEEVA